MKINAMKGLKRFFVFVLCIIMVLLNSITIFADEIEDNQLQKSLTLDAGYIFEYATDDGKDVFIQVAADETDELRDPVLTIHNNGQKKNIYTGEVIGNVVGYHLEEDDDLINISGVINGVPFICELQTLDAGEGETIPDENLNIIGDSVEEDAEIEPYIITDMDVNDDAISEELEDFARTNKLRTGTQQGNLVVVIDPGHSRKSTGTYKTWDGVTYHEEELTMKIARYAKNALEQYGNIQVYLTRDENGDPSIYDRVKFASDKGAALLVSIHLNSAGSVNEQETTANGVEAMVAKIGSYNPGNAQTGQDVAKAILEELVNLGFSNRGFVFKMGNSEYEDGSQADYYGIVRYGQELNIPSIIVEHGFLNNESDFRKYLSTDAGLKSLGEADARGIAKYLDSTVNDEGWSVDSRGDWYYIKNGEKLTDWQIIEGKHYYFYNDGRAATGTSVIEGKKYWFGGDRSQQTGWLDLMGMKLYFNPNEGGAAAIGVCEINGKKYLFDDNGVRFEGDGTPIYNGKKYFLAKSILQTGWLRLGNWDLYFDPDDDGAAAVGQRHIDGKLYNFDSNGILIPPSSGMFVWDGKKYYVLSDGKYYSGWLQLTSDWRLYFDPNDNFAAATGLRKIGEDVYYFDENGVMLQSIMPVIDGRKYFVTDNGKTYKGWMQLTPDWRLYFDPDNGGAATTGFKKISDKIYYFDENGIMFTEGMPIIDGKKYIISKEGWIHTGWLQLTSEWRLYFDPLDNGAAVTGFNTIGSKTYYFDSNGIMNTAGMPVIDGKKYMVNADGSLHKGWLQLTPTWRLYCNPEDNGAILTGFQQVQGKSYYFDENGIMAIGFKKILGKSYCFDGSGVMYAGATPIIDGKKYAFDGNGVQFFGWIELGNYRFYFNPEDNGAAVTGYIEIDNIVYRFNADGILIDSQVRYVSAKDPVNGKTYQLESTYISDPQIGSDITEDEFFASVLYTESGDQGFAGQVAVALTILNRVESSSFPDSLCFVVYAANQFEVARNGTLTKYLNAFKEKDESTLTWLKKSQSLEAVQEARKIMRLYKESGKKRVVEGFTMPEGKDDFSYLFFMTPAAFEKLGLDSEKSNSTIHNGHIFFEKWVKK